MTITPTEKKEGTRINWRGLCEYAASKNHGLPCAILSDRFGGGRHIVKLLSFEDTRRWIARIQREPSTKLTASRLRAEIDTMDFIRTRTKIPVPKIFAYELYDTNIVGAPFMLMEYIPGKSGMDFDHGHQIPLAQKSHFYKDVATIQVMLSSVRLPKIGSIIRRSDNEFDVGPIPGLGGPFSDASEYFTAWASKAKFPLSDAKIKELMAEGPINEVLRSIRDFPHALATRADKLSRNKSGPFPLYHPDFYHSNIMVDKDDFSVLAIIDWEGASTVPWEVVEPPLFLVELPATMHNLNGYNSDETFSKNENTNHHPLSERCKYINIVEQKEQELNADQTLSKILRNSAVQELAYAIKVYHEPGKLGFYCEILRPFDLPLKS